MEGQEGPDEKEAREEGHTMEGFQQRRCMCEQQPLQMLEPHKHMLTRACGAVSSHCPGQSRKDQCLSSSMIHLRGQGLEPS